MAAADASAPVVIDIDKLLAPVSDENPAGEDLRRMASAGNKSILMDDVEEKRRAILTGVNETLEAGQQADPSALAAQRKAEWREIERMVTGAFAKGKELGAAVTLVLAAVSGRGWGALGPGLRFLRLLQEQYWDTLYPVPDTDDEGNPDLLDRLVLLERLDHDSFLPLAIKQLSLTDSRHGDVSWADLKQLEMLRSSKPGEGEDPDAHRASIEEKARALEECANKSTLQFYDRLMQQFDEAETELNNLRDFIDNWYSAAPEDERPNFRRIEDAMAESRNVATRYWKQKGGGKADEVAETAVEISEDGTPMAMVGGVMVPGGDVLGLLEQALSHLRAHQKHNPARFLVEEAIRWTKMPISEWYLEATNDPNMSGFISRLMRGGSDGGSSSPSEESSY